jgi:hypothetical protein
MNLTGFVLELLMPGAIATIAILIALFDAKVPIPITFNSLNGVFGVSLFSVCAYLNGLVLRHATEWFGFLHDRHYYPGIIRRNWPHLCHKLVSIISERLVVAPDGWGREIGATCEKDEIGEGLIIYLREYIFANKQQMLSQFLVYQWNLARMARNSFLPLLLLAASFVIGILKPSSSSATPWIHWLGLAWSLTMSAGVLKAYRDRLIFLTGTLMRFAAFEFHQPKTEADPRARTLEAR